MFTKTSIALGIIFAIAVASAALPLTVVAGVCRRLCRQKPDRFVWLGSRRSRLCPRPRARGMLHSHPNQLLLQDYELQLLTAVRQVRR
jgi:hypothetical protein